MRVSEPGFYVILIFIITCIIAFVWRETPQKYNALATPKVILLTLTSHRSLRIFCCAVAVFWGCTSVGSADRVLGCTSVGSADRVLGCTSVGSADRVLGCTSVGSADRVL